ncbi:MAG: hypothetical protein AB7L66_04590 [Gemmatimonadales bacterium]
MRRLFILLGAVLAAGLPGSAVRAQEAASRWDSVEVLVPSRGLDSIRTDREAYARLRGEADARAGTARLRLAEVEDLLEQIKGEFQSVDGRIKAAKDAKNEPDKTVAEAEKKRLERQRTVLERRRDLRSAEMDEARAESEYAAAAVRALDLEYQLERRRQDGAEPAVRSELEKKTLEAENDMASRAESLAGRRTRIAERRRALSEAQYELIRIRRG